MVVLLHGPPSEAQNAFNAIVFMLLCGALYFLPSIVARKKPQFASVAVLNFFLGWTFVGWVVALAWAVRNEHAA